LPDSLIARLDRHVERMTKEHPGLDFTHADAVRSLLTRALDQIEGPSAPTKRGGGERAAGGGWQPRPVRRRCGDYDQLIVTTGRARLLGVKRVDEKGLDVIRYACASDRTTDQESQRSGRSTCPYP
jgi:hypothetical protein